MAILLGCRELADATDTRPADRDEDARWNLLEIREGRRVVLLINRSGVVDAGGSDGSVVAAALKADPRGARRYSYPYRVIARKLNDYIRKYRSMSAVDETAQADYIIYFNLVEYRRLLNGVYPYGELFVIVNPRPGGRESPGVIWKTKKLMMAEDAVKEFLKELKRVRGEK
ncbi:MAG: hypothetical protein ACRD68_00395 [Pyrinomonadaceae bacterium]